MLSAIILNEIMLGVIMLSAIIPDVVMLSAFNAESHYSNAICSMLSVIILKTIKFYLIKLATVFYWKPSYLLGERASFNIMSNNSAK